MFPVLRRSGDMCKKTATFSTLIVIALMQLVVLPVRADEESDWVNALKISSPEPGATASHVDSYEEQEEKELNGYGSLNKGNPISLRSHAAAHLKDGHIDTAIKLVEQALEQEPDDCTGRQIYADALERRMKKEEPRNPHTYNMCVKQWYYVYRHADYPDMGKLASQHLKSITGKSPVLMPNTKLYLTHVLLPEVTHISYEEEPPAQVH